MMDFRLKIGNDKSIFFLERMLLFFHLEKPLIKLSDMIFYMIAEKKYGDVNELQYKVEDVQVTYAIDDPYSKKWFYLRCKNGRVHEEPATRLLIHDLKDGMCFIDIGAHIGYHTVIASKIVGEQGVVHAFEIDEFNYSLLKKNLEKSKVNNVKAHHIAISDSEDKIQYVRVIDSANPLNHLVYNNETQKNDDIVTVDGISLDEFCYKEKTTPDVIKLDVEGAEYKAIIGMKKLLSNPDIKLFCEIHPYQLSCFGHTVKQVLDIIKACGMEMFEILDMRKYDRDIRLRPITDKDCEINGNTMIYACHKNNISSLEANVLVR